MTKNEAKAVVKVIKSMDLIVSWRCAIKLRLELHPLAPTDRRWSCLDDDKYDGAPDAGWRARLMGWGATAEEAEADYKDMLSDWLDERGGHERYDSRLLVLREERLLYVANRLKAMALDEAVS